MFGEKDMFYKKHSQPHYKHASEIRPYQEMSLLEATEDHQDDNFEQEQEMDNTINRPSKDRMNHYNFINVQQNEFEDGASLTPIQRSSRNGCQLDSDKF